MKRFACGLVIAALMMTMLTLPASARDFSDIQGHWGQTAIQQVSDWNLFFGTGENEFSPDMLMTRGMFVTVMARTAQLLEVTGNPRRMSAFRMCLRRTISRTVWLGPGRMEWYPV